MKSRRLNGNFHRLFLFLTIVITWDATRYFNCGKEKKISDYSGDTYVQDKECKHVRHMEKIFHSAQEARDFLNGAPDCYLPIFGTGLRKIKDRYPFSPLSPQPSFFMDHWKVSVDGTVIFED